MSYLFIYLLKMADSINKALEEHFPDKQVRIIAEPGTYIVGSAFSLVCTVLGRRCIDNAGKYTLFIICHE